MHAAAILALATGIGMANGAALYNRDNALTCGTHGYDKNNPNAERSDCSGDYATFAKCQQYCQGYGSFAFSSTECLCYRCEVNGGNFARDDSSPYAFYDINCPAPDVWNPWPVTSVTSAKATTKATSTTKVATTKAVTTTKAIITTKAVTTTKSATTTKVITTATTTQPASTTTSGSTATTPAGPLTQCPQPLGYLVSKGYVLYSNCLDTDLQIPSPDIYYGIQTNRDCADKCQDTAGCTKGVFNIGTQTCYLKGSPSVADSNWQPNPGFQVIEKIPDGTPLTQCLSAYSIQNNGKTWTVCPGTNFHNNPARAIWYGITTEYECASLCDSFAGCQKFTYSFATQTCYEKGNPSLADALWTVAGGINAYYLQ